MNVWHWNLSLLELKNKSTNYIFANPVFFCVPKRNSLVIEIDSTILQQEKQVTMSLVLNWTTWTSLSYFYNVHKLTYSTKQIILIIWINCVFCLKYICFSTYLKLKIIIDCFVLRFLILITYTTFWGMYSTISRTILFYVLAYWMINCCVIKFLDWFAVRYNYPNQQF